MTTFFDIYIPKKPNIKTRSILLHVIRLSFINKRPLIFCPFLTKSLAFCRQQCIIIPYLYLLF